MIEVADNGDGLLLPLPFPLANDQDGATQLTYTGDRSVRVGSEAEVSAILTDSAGEPLEGMTITFHRGRSLVSAVTDADGVAATSMRVTGPKGSSVLTVSFGGSGDYLPSTIQVPFQVTGPAGEADLSGMVEPCRMSIAA